MARVLVLTDRTPSDPEWKGAFIWRTILSLAECHHEVLVATPVLSDLIPFTHPRLNIIRPVTSWRIDQLPKLIKAIFSFRPDIIHTFALTSSRLWPSLSVWPFLSMIPAKKRITTLFETEDGREDSAVFDWYKNSGRITVFGDHQRNALGRIFSRAMDSIPLDFEVPANEDSLMRDSDTLLIPAAVDQWTDVRAGFSQVAEWLHLHPDGRAHVLGGWRKFPVTARKEIWRNLGSLGAQIDLSEEAGLEVFLTELRRSNSLCLTPLHKDSWKFTLSSQLGRQLGKPVITSRSEGPELVAGSTANSLSRLYAGL